MAAVQGIRECIDTAKIYSALKKLKLSVYRRFSFLGREEDYEVSDERTDDGDR